MPKWKSWIMTNDPNNRHVEMWITATSLKQAKEEYSKRNGNCPLDSIQVTLMCADVGKQFVMYWQTDALFRQGIKDILKERGETEEDLWRGLGVRPDDF